MAQAQQPVRIRRIQGEPNSVTDVIDRTKRTLALCQLGLKDLLESTDVTRQIAGIATVAVQGRAVTNVIQKIRGFDQVAFDAWYQPYAREMNSDELLRYFYVLRSVILKDGAPKVLVTNSLEPRPKSLEGLGSTGFLPGVTDYSAYFKSSYVETGFLQSKPSYIELPVKQNSDVVLVLPNPPYRHRGEPISDISAQGICLLYVKYLGDFVRDAVAHFSEAAV